MGLPPPIGIVRCVRLALVSLVEASRFFHGVLLWRFLSRALAGSNRIVSWWPSLGYTEMDENAGVPGGTEAEGECYFPSSGPFLVRFMWICQRFFG